MTTTTRAGYPALTAGMIALATLGAFEALAVTTAMPSVARELDGLALYAIAFAAPLASGVVGMVLAGNWADRSGPRTPLLVTVAVFLVSLLISGAAPDMVVFVLGRVLQGVGAGGMVVAMYVVVGRAYAPETHSRIFAWFAAAWVVPSLVGPLVAGLVTEAFGWRWVFLGVAALVLPASALLVPGLRMPQLGRAPEGERHPWHLRRIATGIAAAVVVLAMHVVAGSAETLEPTLLWGAVLLGTVAAVAAVRPLVPQGTLTSRPGLPSAVSVRGLVGAGYLAAEAYLPLLLSERYGFTASQAGLVLTMAALLWASTAWIQGRFDGAERDRVLIRVGTVLLTAAIASVLAVIVLALPPALLIGAWAFAGAGMGLMYSRFAVVTLRLSPERDQGFNSAAGQIAEYSGIAVLLATVGSLFLVLQPLGVLAFAAALSVPLAASVLAALLAGRVQPKAQLPTETRELPVPV